MREPNLVLAFRAVQNSNKVHVHVIPLQTLRYDKHMKRPPDNPEFARFTQAMRHIMGVTKVELKAREEADKVRKAKRKRVKVKTTAQST